MIELAALALVAAEPKSVEVPLNEFSTSNLFFVCLSEPQPSGKTAHFVALGIDYEKTGGVVDYNADVDGKFVFAILKDPVKRVTTEQSASGRRWAIEASGEFEGRPVVIHLKLVRRGQGLIADYVIKDGAAQYIGTDCIPAPTRPIRGYDALLQARKKRGRQ